MTYVVHILETRGTLYYDKEGKGYSLSSAKNFARIASQTGKPRVVTRGLRGPVIRIYERGERAWPLYDEQVNKLKGSQSLTPREMPASLYFPSVDKQRQHTVVTTKTVNGHRALPKKEPYRTRYEEHISRRFRASW